MKYAKIKTGEQKRLEQLSDDVGLFWAFSNEQFAEGKKKNPVAEGEKYTSIGAGGFLPSKNVQQWIDGMKAVETWVKEAKKDAKEVILYELNNYECFYTGDIADAMPRLTELGYTTEQVKEVYHANRGFALN